MTQLPGELAVDAGQSGIRARSVGASAEFVERNYPGIRTDLPLLPQIAAAVRDFAATTGTDIRVVSAALSGLTDEDPTELLHALSDLGVTAVHLTHDSTSGYLGALGDSTGCVTAVGTGVVTLAVGAREVARVDGWGYIMGDAGSGYWIGRAGLEAGMRGYDGRAEPTALTDLVRDNFRSIEDAYIELQTDPERVARVASFAKTVVALAETDAAADRIVDDAVAQLVLAVTSALRRVGFTAQDSPAVSWVGRILGNPSVSARFVDQLGTAWPNARPAPPLGEPLDGVALLPRLAATNPLFARVRSAHS